MLERKTQDFLYWHAVSKMRMSEFSAAAKLFRLLHGVAPQQASMALGQAYCLMRTGQLDQAMDVLTELRRSPLHTEEMALLGRLYRRCDFERARLRRGQQARVNHHNDSEILLPHTLGNG